MKDNMNRKSILALFIIFHFGFSLKGQNVTIEKTDKKRRFY